MGDAPERLTPDELWAVWRRVVRAAPWVRMPLEWFISPTFWSLFGVDFVTGLTKDRVARRLFAVLEPLPPFELRRIHALAALNHRRHEVISRWFAIGFVTLPASAALILSELSPETLAWIAGQRGWAQWQLMLGYIAVIVALYLMWAWRARQLLALVEVWLILRGVLAHEAHDQTHEDPLSPPLGA